MRDLAVVLDKILTHIPKKEQWDNLRCSLKSIGASATYAAPEVKGQFWRHAALVLNGELGEPIEPWQVKIAQIFGGTDEKAT